MTSTSKWFREPRALWEIFEFRNAADAGLSTTQRTRNFIHNARLRSTPAFWHNGTGYPITLTRILCDSLTYDPFDGLGTVDPLSYLIQLSVPYRHIWQRYALRSAAWLDSAGAGHILHPEAAFDTQDPVAQVYRWDFAHPYSVGPSGRFLLDLSHYYYGGDQAAVDTPLRTAVLVRTNDQAPARYRLRQTLLPLAQTADVQAVPYWAVHAATRGYEVPPGNNPFVPAAVTGVDPGGSGAGANPAPATTDLWPASGMFSSSEWDRQQGHRPGGDDSPRLVHGFAVTVDAIDIDAGATTRNSRMWGNELGTRVRMDGAGTRQAPWREGAPLSLVSPSETSALVIDLEAPIVLAPGDQLEVEVQIGDDSTDDSVTADRRELFAMSMCGFADVKE